MTTDALTITDFLLARIAEDGAEADLSFSSEQGKGTWHDWIHRECEAKRRIVQAHHLEFWGVSDGRTGQGCTSCYSMRRHPDRGRAFYEPVEYPCPTLRFLALPYAAHPDYHPEWRS